jgi:hypothetical protein
LSEIEEKTSFERRIAAVRKQYKLNDRSFKRYTQIFDLFDTDGSGEIDVVELRLAHQLADISLSPKGADRLIRILRGDNRGVRLDNFLDFFLGHDARIQMGTPTLQEVTAVVVVVRVLQKKVLERRAKIRIEQQTNWSLSLEALRQTRLYLHHQEDGAKGDVLLLKAMEGACSAFDASSLKLTALCHGKVMDPQPQTEQDATNSAMEDGQEHEDKETCTKGKEGLFGGGDRTTVRGYGALPSSSPQVTPDQQTHRLVTPNTTKTVPKPAAVADTPWAAALKLRGSLALVDMDGGTSDLQLGGVENVRIIV